MNLHDDPAEQANKSGPEETATENSETSSQEASTDLTAIDPGE